MSEEMNYTFEKMLTEEDFNIDYKKFFYTIWHRKLLAIKVFSVVLLFFILLTFIIPKKWKVEADLYIKHSNSSNYADINPYALEEATSISSMLASSNPLANEIELMQSPLVIDKVIRENDLRFKPLLGFIRTAKTGEYLTTKKFLKKKINFENKKGTNVISISYKCKDKDESYNVINSIIANYIDLYKQINIEKSKSDKKIIESEYQKAKLNLDKKVATSGGLPTNSMTGTGNLAALSAFSKSAQSAMSTLKGQYIAGEKARIEISEDATKVTQLASKLEWARLVDEMSDSSKVIVIKKPYQLRDWEYTSPKLLINIFLGIVFGIIFALLSVFFAEYTDKKLTYTILGDNIIYDLDKELNILSTEVISNSDKKTAFIFFEEISKQTYEKFKDFVNVTPVKAEISNSFKESLNGVDNIVTFASIGKTDSEKYKLVKKMISNLDKKVLYEVLV